MVCYSRNPLFPFRTPTPLCFLYRLIHFLSHVFYQITGSKAPPLKHLAEWLDKNPQWDVDPKWSPLVKEKGNLPTILKDRLQMPKDR